jgi:lincosamide nucleotidyltransferase A/C/D/E
VSRFETTIADVHCYLDLFDSLGISVWIDGGWGVDALLGDQTRVHEDLDIVLPETDAAALRAALFESDHVDIPRDDTRAWNFVMGLPGVRQIDFHVVVFDHSGDGIYGPPENGDRFPASAFTGVGRIGGRPVQCMSAEYQVTSHTGYPLSLTDLADVVALRDRFGVALDPVHEKYLRES